MADASRSQGNPDGSAPDGVVAEGAGEGPDAIEQGGILHATDDDGGPSPDGPVFPFDREKQKADTARNIAYALVVILGASVFLHYLVISVTPLPAESALRLEAYKAAFNAWLPVASGLVSAAVTYYFTRDRDGKQ